MIICGQRLLCDKNGCEVEEGAAAEAEVLYIRCTETRWLP